MRSQTMTVPLPRGRDRHRGSNAARLTLLLLLFTLASVSLAQAHATLVASVPPHGAILTRCPATITLRFNATLEPTMTRAHLIDMRQTRTPLDTDGESSTGKVMIHLPEMQAGVYTLVYKVLARDGHLTEGSLRFTILQH